MSGKHSRVFPVRVHQEAGEAAVCLGAGVKSIVLWESHLHPHLIAGDEVKQGAAWKRCWFRPVAIKLKIRSHSVSVLHQVELQAGAVHRGVDGKVVDSRDFAGEASRLWVVVALFIDQDGVKADCVAHIQGRGLALREFDTEGGFRSHCTLARLPPFPLFSRVTPVSSQASHSCLTWRGGGGAQIWESCTDLSHAHKQIHISTYLGPLSPLSPPFPQEQHPSHPSHLSLADQDCHEPQESLGYQGGQYTDWGGSYCPLTGWKDGLVGRGWRGTGTRVWVRSLQSQGWEKTRNGKKTDEQAQTDLCTSNTALQTMGNIDLTKQKKTTTTTKIKQNIMKITEGWRAHVISGNCSIHKHQMGDLHTIYALTVKMYSFFRQTGSDRDLQKYVK